MEFIEIELVRAWNYRDIGSRLTPPVGQAELMIQTGIAKRVSPEPAAPEDGIEMATDARAETAEMAVAGHHLRKRKRRR